MPNDENIPQGLKAINFFECKAKDNKPYILLDGEYLFETGFLPNQFLKCEVFDQKLIISPVFEPPNEQLKILIK